MSKNFVLGAVSILIALLLGAIVSGLAVKAHFKAILDTFPHDTIVEYRTDTLKVLKPVYLEKKVYDTLKISIRDTAYLVKTDTLYLPREQKHYGDSTYSAWVSGVSPSLDSIYVYPKTTIMKIPTPVYQKRKWAIGLQGGVGAVQPFDDAFKPKLGYYLGLGVQMNF